MRKVFLDDLPRWGKSGKGKEGTINWGKCVGLEIPFIYNDIMSNFKILQYDKNKRVLRLRYNNEEGHISTGNIAKCKIGGLLVSYKTYKSDNFEICNILKMNEKGILWESLKSGNILKTNHKKYGYNEFEFIRYDKKESRLYLKYNKEEVYIQASGFLGGAIGKLLNEHTSEYKVSVGDNFTDEKRNLIIIDREYRKQKHGNGIINGKWYKYKCNKCGWDNGWIMESDLLKNKGCSCCNGKTVVNGINDMMTTAPWMIDLGISIEDALKHTKTSGKNIKVKCPDCGTCKNIKISDISTSKSIGCRTCGDSVSFPEKFINSVLTQTGVVFETQKVLFKSKNNRIRYDFYFEYKDKKCIIEVHGMQHYGDGFESCGGRTLNEEIANDKYKKLIAIQNGIDEYIVLDCRYSELEWIKNEVLASTLNKLLNLADINWNSCEKYALSNIVKIICNEWSSKEEYLTTGDFAKRFNLGYNTISRYLKRGNVLGWVEYNPQNEVNKVAKSNGDKLKDKNSIKTHILKNGVLVGEFSSATELERQSEKLFGTRLDHQSISRVARGLQKQYKGYTFKYVD